MKISSNTAAAEAAVSGFAGINAEAQGQRVNLSTSNIASMKDGAKLSNKIVQDISALVLGVKAEADRVTALAKKVEARDQQDASSIGPSS